MYSYPHPDLVAFVTPHYTSQLRIRAPDVPENSQGGNFPPTRHSVVFAAQSDDPATRLWAIETIAAAYWRPVYKYARVKWNITSDDAADFTQDFFTRLLEKEFLDSYDRSKGMLRTYLRTCADRLFMNQTRDANRLKRGAGAVHFSLDAFSLNFDDAEQELTAMPRSESPEDCFDKEWVRSLFALGLERCRAICEASGKTIHFELFARYDLEEADPRPSYAQLAEEFGLTTTDVTNYLAFARREFRRRVLEQLRQMTGTEEEFRREARALLGAEVK